MNTGLKRIESTLQQLETPQSNNPPTNPEEKQQESKTPSLSFTLKEVQSHNQTANIPNLPKFKSVSISTHRNAANPALAMNLLKDMEVVVAQWQEELQTVVRQIQDLYMEGPIIDGWLESPSGKAKVNEQVSQAQKDHLLDYVEEITDGKVAYQSPRPGYRLCGLGEDGKPWSKPCPPQQVADVSLAIARYQKLRIFLNSKENLENRLGQLSEALIILHSTLSEEKSLS